MFEVLKKHQSEILSQRLRRVPRPVSLVAVVIGLQVWPGTNLSQTNSPRCGTPGTASECRAAALVSPEPPRSGFKFVATTVVQIYICTNMHKICKICKNMQ